MGVNISYMGTKRELAGAVADVVSAGAAGPMLDLFSGMCSVGEAVGTARQVWTNDAQVFASAVGAALFTSRSLPLSAQAIADEFHERFVNAIVRATDKWAASLEIERRLLAAPTFAEFENERALLQQSVAACVSDEKGPWPCLFTQQYADTFFGVSQVIEIDAIVESVRGGSPSQYMDEQQRWLMIALGRSMLRVSTTTGHFAQYLKPKIDSFRTFQRQRNRVIWNEWLSSCDELHPVGDFGWRSLNRSFNEDSLMLLPKLQSSNDRPGVIYADPPYTNDQYSRYYHIFETLMLYDYPNVNYAGLYREGRFTTSFSLKSHAPKALHSLISGVGRLGADLVLSYPTNGLAHQKGIDIVDMMSRHFCSVEVCYAISHDHSTFGASKGAAKSTVTEMLYMGRS